MESSYQMSMAGDGILSRYPLFESNDLDETRHQVSRVFCDHRLDILGSRQKLHAQMYHTRIGGVSFNRLHYGAGVAIDSGCLKDFYLVQMPTAGSEEIHCAGQTIVSEPSHASVISPTLPMRKIIRANTRKLVLQIDRGFLERLCAQFVGHDLDRPLVFELGMPLDKGTGVDWRNLVTFFYRQLSADNNLFQAPLLRVQLEQLIGTTLLLGQQNNFSHNLLAPDRVIAPRFVKKAEEFILTHAEQPISIADIAQYAGISLRSLFKGFRKYHHTTPKAMLNKVRLEKVRAELLAGGAHRETVTQVAMRYGFYHLGRFAAEYRKRFGELPSQTLRNA